LDRHRPSSELVALPDEASRDRHSVVISPGEAILRREIARLLAERTALRQEVSAHSATIAQQSLLAEALVAAQAETRRLESRMLDALGEATYYHSVVQALYRSRSWKVTKPIRVISSLLRRSPAPVRPKLLPETAHGTRSDPIESEPPAPDPVPKTSRGHLFIAADMPPLFDQQAGALRLMTLIGLLGEMGWTLTFGSLLGREQLPGVLTTLEGRAHYEACLARLGVGQVLYGLADIGDYLDQTSSEVDWAFLSFPAVATAIMPLIRCRFPSALVIYDMVDSHGLRMAREAALHNDAAKFAEGRRVRREEVGLALSADVTLAITADERDRLLTEAPQAVVRVLPLVFDVPPPTPSTLGDRRGLFFIGSFWHKPNADGMIWFVDAIWPLIRAEMPAVRMTIAGSNMGEDVLALAAHPGIDVIGFVPEVQPVLDAHRVFVAPLRFGAGMKGKVAQSMIHGLPVVTTSIGAEGMALDDTVHVLVADEPALFAQAVVSLLRDDDLWQRLSTQGRQHIERTLSRDTVRTQLESVFGG
jgi:hypothetical protein